MDQSLFFTADAILRMLGRSPSKGPDDSKKSPRWGPKEFFRRLFRRKRARRDILCKTGEV